MSKSTIEGGPTELHQACYVQDLNSVALLLEGGADPHVLDPEFGSDAAGWLDQGVFDGNGPGTEIAKLLMEHGVDVDASRCVVFALPGLLESLLEAEPAIANDRPLLHDAVYLDRPACIDVLLRAGASPTKTFRSLDDADYHISALALAEQLGRPLPPQPDRAPAG